MSDRLTKLQAVIVPHWVFKALHRNNLNTIDLLSYTKLRTILSIDDMAEYLYLNQGFKINGIPLAHVDIISELTCHSSLTSAEKAELQNSVVPLSGSEEIAKSVISKLTGSNLMADCYQDCMLYQFIQVDNTIFIILERGFIDYVLGKEDTSIEFIRKYLKHCYAMESISEVSHFSIFQLYLNNLAKQAI